MLKIKTLFLPLIISIASLFFATPVLAGGWPVYNYSWDNPNQWQNGGLKMSYVRSHLAPGITCKGTTVTFKYENPQPGDTVTAIGPDATYTFTEDLADCSTYAKFMSTNNAEKIVIIEFKIPDGIVYARKYVLNFQLPTPGNTSDIDKNGLPWKINTQTPAPIPYPMPEGDINLQLIKQRFIAPFDREVVLKFGWSVTSGNVFYNIYTRIGNDDWQKMLTYVEGPSASIKVKAYEDYRIKVEGCIKKFGNCTGSREIPLPKLEEQKGKVEIPAPSMKPGASLVPVPTAAVTTVSSDTAKLQQKVENLQKQLQESQKRQASLENTVNDLLKWIKSAFPFFK